jgi:hypothetical protein
MQVQWIRPLTHVSCAHARAIIFICSAVIPPFVAGSAQALCAGVFRSLRSAGRECQAPLFEGTSNCRGTRASHRPPEEAVGGSAWGFPAAVANAFSPGWYASWLCLTCDCPLVALPTPPQGGPKRWAAALGGTSRSEAHNDMVCAARTFFQAPDLRFFSGSSSVFRCSLRPPLRFLLSRVLYPGDFLASLRSGERKRETP